MIPPWGLGNAPSLLPPRAARPPPDHDRSEEPAPRPGGYRKSAPPTNAAARRPRHDPHREPPRAWIGGVCASLLPCHGCGSASGSDRAPADARTSSQARASPITAAFVAEGNCGEPLGGPVPSAAFAGERVV